MTTTFEIRMVVDGVEQNAVVMKTKPAKVTLTLTKIESTDAVTVLGTKEIVVP